MLLGCAQAPDRAPQRAAETKETPATLGALPATYVSQAGCPGCLAATVTLRPDSSFLLRDQLGASEFHDFGRWRFAGGILELAGDRDTRTYPLANLRRATQVETPRGPFRMVGLYDGTRFKECRTGIAWSFAETRAAETLRQEFRKQPGGPAGLARRAARRLARNSPRLQARHAAQLAHLPLDWTHGKPAHRARKPA